MNKVIFPLTSQMQRLGSSDDMSAFARSLKLLRRGIALPLTIGRQIAQTIYKGFSR